MAATPIGSVVVEVKPLDDKLTNSFNKLDKSLDRSRVLEEKLNRTTEKVNKSYSNLAKVVGGATLATGVVAGVGLLAKNWKDHNAAAVVGVKHASKLTSVFSGLFSVFKRGNQDQKKFLGTSLFSKENWDRVATGAKRAGRSLLELFTGTKILKASAALDLGIGVLSKRLFKFYEVLSLGGMATGALGAGMLSASGGASALGASFTVLGGAAVSASAAIASLISLVGSKLAEMGSRLKASNDLAVQSFSDFQGSVFSLNSTLEGYKQVSKDYSVSSEKIIKQNQKLSAATGFSIQSLNEAQQLLLSFNDLTGLTADNIAMLTEESAKYARVTGQDLTSIMIGIDNYFRGYRQTLQSVGIALEDTDLKQTEYAKTLGKLSVFWTKYEKAQATAFAMQEKLSRSTTGLTNEYKTYQQVLQALSSQYEQINIARGEGVTDIRKQFAEAELGGVVLARNLGYDSIVKFNAAYREGAGTALQWTGASLQVFNIIAQFAGMGWLLLNFTKLVMGLTTAFKGLLGIVGLGAFPRFVAGVAGLAGALTGAGALAVLGTGLYAGFQSTDFAKRRREADALAQNQRERAKMREFAQQNKTLPFEDKGQGPTFTGPLSPYLRALSLVDPIESLTSPGSNTGDYLSGRFFNTKDLSPEQRESLREELDAFAKYKGLDTFKTSSWKAWTRGSGFLPMQDIMDPMSLPEGMVEEWQKFAAERARSGKSKLSEQTANLKDATDDIDKTLESVLLDLMKEGLTPSELLIQHFTQTYESVLRANNTLRDKLAEAAEKMEDQAFLAEIYSGVEYDPPEQQKKRGFNRYQRELEREQRASREEAQAARERSGAAAYGALTGDTYGSSAGGIAAARRAAEAAVRRDFDIRREENEWRTKRLEERTSTEEGPLLPEQQARQINDLKRLNALKEQGTRLSEKEKLALNEIAASYGGQQGELAAERLGSIVNSVGQLVDYDQKIRGYSKVDLERQLDLYQTRAEAQDRHLQLLLEESQLSGRISSKQSSLIELEINRQKQLTTQAITYQQTLRDLEIAFNKAPNAEMRDSIIDKQNIEIEKNRIIIGQIEEEAEVTKRLIELREQSSVQLGDLLEDTLSRNATDAIFRKQSVDDSITNVGKDFENIWKQSFENTLKNKLKFEGLVSKNIFKDPGGLMDIFTRASEGISGLLSKESILGEVAGIPDAAAGIFGVLGKPGNPVTDKAQREASLNGVLATAENTENTVRILTAMAAGQGVQVQGVPAAQGVTPTPGKQAGGVIPSLTNILGMAGKAGGAIGTAGAGTGVLSSIRSIISRSPSLTKAASTGGTALGALGMMGQGLGESFANVIQGANQYAWLGSLFGMKQGDLNRSTLGLTIGSGITKGIDFIKGGGLSALYSSVGNIINPGAAHAAGILSGYTSGALGGGAGAVSGAAGGATHAANVLAQQGGQYGLQATTLGSTSLSTTGASAATSFGTMAANIGTSVMYAGLSYAATMAGTAIANTFSQQNKEGQIGNIAGTAIGSVIGTMILPGIGTVIGAFLGSLIGQAIGSLFGSTEWKQLRSKLGQAITKQITGVYQMQLMNIPIFPPGYLPGVRDKDLTGERLVGEDDNDWLLPWGFRDVAKFSPFGQGGPNVPGLNESWERRYGGTSVDPYVSALAGKHGLYDNEQIGKLPSDLFGGDRGFFMLGQIRTMLLLMDATAEEARQALVGFTRTMVEDFSDGFAKVTKETIKLHGSLKDIEDITKLGGDKFAGYAGQLGLLIEAFHDLNGALDGYDIATRIVGGRMEEMTLGALDNTFTEETQGIADNIKTVLLPSLMEDLGKGTISAEEALLRLNEELQKLNMVTSDGTIVPFEGFPLEALLPSEEEVQAYLDMIQKSIDSMKNAAGSIFLTGGGTSSGIVSNFQAIAETISESAIQTLNDIVFEKSPLAVALVDFADTMQKEVRRALKDDRVIDADEIRHITDVLRGEAGQVADNYRDMIPLIKEMSFAMFQLDDITAEIMGQWPDYMRQMAQQVREMVGETDQIFIRAGELARDPSAYNRLTDRASTRLAYYQSTYGVNFGGDASTELLSKYSPIQAFHALKNMTDALEDAYSAEKMKIEANSRLRLEALDDEAESINTVVRQMERASEKSTRWIERALEDIQPWVSVTEGARDMKTGLRDQLLYNNQTPRRRLQEIETELGLVRGKFEGAGDDETRAFYAGQLEELLQKRLDLAQQIYRRPSVEFQNLLSDTTAWLDKIISMSKGDEERQFLYQQAIQADQRRVRDATEAMRDRLEDISDETLVINKQQRDSLRALDSAFATKFGWLGRELEDVTNAHLAELVDLFGESADNILYKPLDDTATNTQYILDLLRDWRNIPTPPEDDGGEDTGGESTDTGGDSASMTFENPAPTEIVVNAEQHNYGYQATTSTADQRFAQVLVREIEKSARVGRLQKITSRRFR